MSEFIYLLEELRTGDPDFIILAIGAFLLITLVWGDSEKFAFKAIAAGILAVGGTVAALYLVAGYLS